MEGIEITHAYHLVPGGASKGKAVGAHMRTRGYAPEECIAAGDSIEDLGAAEYVGRFFCMANGPEKDAALREALAEYPNVTVTEGRMGEGVYEAVVSTLAGAAARSAGLEMEASRPWPLNVAGLEPIAAERLEPQAYDYYRSGAGDELTLARNHAAFERIELLPHVLVDVSEVDLGIRAAGHAGDAPVAGRPDRLPRSRRSEGELATRRAAPRPRTLPSCLSSLSNTPIEEVGAAAGPTRGSGSSSTSSATAR